MLPRTVGIEVLVDPICYSHYSENSTDPCFCFLKRSAPSEGERKLCLSSYLGLAVNTEGANWAFLFILTACIIEFQ